LLTYSASAEVLRLPHGVLHQLIHLEKVVNNEPLFGKRSALTLSIRVMWAHCRLGRSNQSNATNESGNESINWASRQ
jgi:hypothetical protein